MHISPPGLFDRLTELADTLAEHAERFRRDFADHHTDNPIYDRAVEVVTDRCRWVKNNVLARRPG